MSNLFNCPDGLYRVLMLEKTPMLAAIKDLGPERVQYLSDPTPFHMRGRHGAPVSWALDGARATDQEILAAAELATRRQAA